MATPIGNLGDFSARARAVLEAANVIAAEDTRTTQRLFAERPRGRMVSLTEHNVDAKAAALVDEARTGIVALVSEAGTPAVADPGARLVAAAHAADVPVFAIPGPSALAAALSVAGFDGSSATFLGFLPKKTGERRGVITRAAEGAEILVFFESPRRAGRTLAELAEWLSDPEVTVCRELTKVHEEVVRGRASELAPRFAETRGECTIVVAVPPATATAEESELRAYLAEMQRAGARRAGAAPEAARRFGVPRQVAYELWPNPEQDEGL